MFFPKEQAIHLLWHHHILKRRENAYFGSMNSFVPIKVKISGNLLVYFSGVQFVNNLLTGLFFSYKNLWRLLPALLRVFLGMTIKNPDNHLDISSFFFFLLLFLTKNSPLSLGCILYSAFFVFLSALFLYSPHQQELVGLSPSLSLSFTVNVITLGTPGKFPDVNKNINPFASLLLLCSLLYFPPPVLQKYFCMFCHPLRLRVEDMKSEANKTSSCF